MPFVHLSTTKAISTKEKAELANEIAKLVSTMPGKPYERTMVKIEAECEIYRAGELAECAYFQTHFRKPVSIELQKAYIEKMYALFYDKLRLETQQIYMSMIALDTWGSRGTLSE